MFETIKNAFLNKDIRKKIIITLLLLLVFRLGCYIPVPGLDRSVFSDVITGSGANSFLSLMSSVTGGALANGTLFALGIGPYINASIIVELLTVGIPALERMSKEGEEGQKEDHDDHADHYDRACDRAVYRYHREFRRRVRRLEQRSHPLVSLL